MQADLLPAGTGFGHTTATTTSVRSVEAEAPSQLSASIAEQTAPKPALPPAETFPPERWYVPADCGPPPVAVPVSLVAEGVRCAAGANLSLTLRQI